jgi:hypothetical protein
MQQAVCVAHEASFVPRKEPSLIVASCTVPRTRVCALRFGRSAEVTLVNSIVCRGCNVLVCVAFKRQV